MTYYTFSSWLTVYDTPPFCNYLTISLPTREVFVSLHFASSPNEFLCILFSRVKQYHLCSGKFCVRNKMASPAGRCGEVIYFWHKLHCINMNLQPHENSWRLPSLVKHSTGPRFNIKTPSYQFRDSHNIDKTVWPSYPYSGYPYTWKDGPLRWDGAHGACSFLAPLRSTYPVDVIVHDGGVQRLEVFKHGTINCKRNRSPDTVTYIAKRK